MLIAKNLVFFVTEETFFSFFFSAGIYLLRVNYRNTRTKVWNMFKVNNKATKTTPGIVLVTLLLTLNIFHTFVLVFLLLTLNM